VLALLSTRPQAAAAYRTAAGVLVLVAGGVCTVVAYSLMLRIGRLPDDPRVLR
jgi:tight adherence protein B